MKRIATLILLLIMVFGNLCTYAETTSKESEYNSRMSEFKKFVADHWVKLAQFSLSSKLMRFYEKDSARAKAMGGRPPVYEGSPVLTDPEDARDKYIQWGKLRSQMLTQVEQKASALLKWCQENHKSNVGKVAKTILKELPGNPEAMKALGYIYSNVVGWKNGEDAKHIQNGELPFGRRWLPAEEVLEYRSDWVNAWEISDGFFKVRTNTTPELSRKLLSFLEKFRQWYMDTFETVNLKFDRKELTINLFSDRDTYNKISQLLFDGRSSSPGAYYFEKTGQTYVVAGTGRNNYLFPKSIVAHEHSHQFLHQYTNVLCRFYYDKPGGWINEALASYCETPLEVADRLVITGYRYSHHFGSTITHLKNKTLLPLKDFVLLTGGDGEKGPNRMLVYNQGMSLIAYLLHANGGKHAERLKIYIRGVLKGNGATGYFRRVFGVSPQDLQEHYTKWLTQHRNEG